MNPEKNNEIFIDDSFIINCSNESSTNLNKVNLVNKIESDSEDIIDNNNSSNDSIEDENENNSNDDENENNSNDEDENENNSNDEDENNSNSEGNTNIDDDEAIQIQKTIQNILKNTGASISSDESAQMSAHKKNTDSKPTNNTDQDNLSSQKARRVPKTILANQQKYLETREKERKILDKAKGKGNKNEKTKTDSKNTQTTQSVQSNAGKSDQVNTGAMKRVVIAGKVRYVPILESNEGNEGNEGNHNQSQSEKPIPVKNSNQIPSHMSNQIDGNKSDGKQTLNKPNKQRSIDPVSKEIDPYESRLNSTDKSNRTNSSNEKTLKQLRHNTDNTPQRDSRIPSKYAKEIEKTVKHNTTKNVKSFADLRRVRALENLDTSVDVNTSSMVEIRRLKTEQRKKELAEAKHRVENNKSESAVQKILNDDKMSKFSKTVAIKNLSANSRTKKRNPVVKNTSTNTQHSTLNKEITI